MSLSGEQVVTICVAGFASLTSIIVMLIQTRKERRLTFEKESVRVFGLVFDKLVYLLGHYDLSQEYREQLTQGYSFFLSQSPYLNYDLYAAGDEILSTLVDEIKVNHTHLDKQSEELITKKLQEYETYMQKHYFYATGFNLKKRNRIK